jgi:hypothetical protein
MLDNNMTEVWNCATTFGFIVITNELAQLILWDQLQDIRWIYLEIYIFMALARSIRIIFDRFIVQKNLNFSPKVFTKIN